MISPVDGGRGQAVLLYTDIFQLTESTLRTARRLASSGFVVCVPEIYPHGELAGVALEFDDAGKQAGLAGAAATSTAQFDADRVAVLDYLARQPGRRRAVARSASASVATWRSGPRSTRGSRRRCASTRPGCRTAQLGADADAGRSPGRGHPRPSDDRLRFAGPARPAPTRGQSCRRCTPPG